MNSSEANQEFEQLLDYLNHSQGCDLTGYKRPSLMRRFLHRMYKVNVDSYQGYLEYLQNHSQEWLALLDDVLINVTSFFRDREAWDYLASDIIPKIIANKQPDEPIRLWSAGCAAGQEVYSLLMLFAEALGIESCLTRIHCYATDADEVALKQARQGIYHATEIMGIPSNLLEKYFEQTEQGYVFAPRLRRKIIFARHNLAEDAPISKIDLLSCRNVLIYLNPDTQGTIMVRFHFSLKNTGFLFLGKAETFTNRRPIFKPINCKHRVYAKGVNLEIDDHLLINPKSHKKQAIDPLKAQMQFWQTAFEASPFAQLAVDIKGCLIGANEQANILFELTVDNWGRPFRELEPGKLVESYAAIRTFYRNHRPVTLKNVEWQTSNGKKSFDIAIAAVFSNKQLLGTNLTFIDITNSKQLAKELEDTRSNLARLSKKLEETKYKLNNTHMELESSRQEVETLHQEMQFMAQNRGN